MFGKYFSQGMALAGLNKIFAISLASLVILAGLKVSLFANESLFYKEANLIEYFEKCNLLINR